MLLGTLPPPSYNSNWVVVFFLLVQPPEDDDSSDSNGNGAKKRKLQDKKEAKGWRVAVTNLPYSVCTEEAMRQVCLLILAIDDDLQYFSEEEELKQLSLVDTIFA